MTYDQREDLYAINARLYTSRKAKSINNPRNEGDRCELCRHARFLSERYKAARKVEQRERRP